MENQSPQMLFKAITSDNTTLFSQQIVGKENLLFGRFPILSLCYLYRAKKIIKLHFSKLNKNFSSFQKVSEPSEISTFFIAVAGRALRLYQSENSIVTPKEMCAILRKDSSLKRLCRISSTDNDTRLRLKNIFLIRKQTFSINGNTIKIGFIPFTTMQKKFITIALSVIATLVLTITSLYIPLHVTVGSATKNNPYIIRNEKQLANALNSSGYFALNNDITLTRPLDIENFNGNLDGRNHTLYFNTIPNNAQINSLNGSVSNLNLQYSAVSATINSSLSLFVNENNGSINNVNITCSALDLNVKKSGQNDIYICAVATTNNKTVSNCSVSMKLNITSATMGECMASGVVGKNTSTVSDCIVTSGSSITAQETDIGGIVAQNEHKASINTCRNYAQLSQTSQLNEWSPNVGGIAIMNKGTIANSINFGSLNVVSNNIGVPSTDSDIPSNPDNSGESNSSSDNTQENYVFNNSVVENNNKNTFDDSDSTNDNLVARGSVLLGGIVAQNNGTLTKSLNKGNLTAKSKKIIVYAGGIVAYAEPMSINSKSFMNPVIDGCGAICNIDTSVEKENSYVFSGGVAGVFYGFNSSEAIPEAIIENSFSACSFAQAHDKNKYFCGALLGQAVASYNIFGIFPYFTPNNNVVLTSPNANMQIASMTDEYSRIFNTGANHTDISLIASVATMDELTQSEVFWNEE